MESSTFGRWLTVLTLGLVAACVAFLAGARAGAALNGHVNGLTFANTPMPRIEAAAVAPAPTPVANNK
jgi:hypothetical protein